MSLRQLARKYLPATIALLALLALWQVLATSGAVPSYMLPSPGDVLAVFPQDGALLAHHTLVTLQEAALGLAAGVAAGFAFAVLMDAFGTLRRAVYPLLVLSQTVPVVAIAPLLVLWLGYGIAPKVVLVALATFFPVAVGLLQGFQSVDQDEVSLMRSMGASRWQVFRFVKIPGALPEFFSGLRIAAAYAVVGAVISEWLGGFSGLGVYMTRVQKAFAFDKMFAVIFVVSAISLVLMLLVGLVERRAMPWRHVHSEKEKR
ncbi:ABC transporter permease [Adlercreutzia sp. ZJ242]|uniref:ABC transporter permease n=1 Tax=Adlercreutzia sp. ZJ242 TaxID=2709409 RepID=UPI0013EE1BE8|nr:ABC transporter permease [Adlercreutzia sp. ZJ242]